MDIIIDTVGQADLLTKSRLIESDDEDDVDIGDNSFDAFQEFDTNDLDNNAQKITKKKKKTSSKDIDLDEFERDMGWKKIQKKQPEDAINFTKMANEVSPLDKILEKSAIKPGFEQLEAVPPYYENKKKLKKQRKLEREKTKGKKWFNLPAPEMTDEVKHDLEVIQMRSVLNPKHFYKKNDLKALPKYFQIGKVIDSPLDYYSGRLTKKERKKTIVEELMADAEFSKYNKRKYKEIIDEKRKLHYKAHRHAKKLKRKKK